MGWGARSKEGTHLARNRVPLIQRAGVIAVVCGDRTTYPQFAAHISMVQAPAGTQLLWQLSGGGTVAAARNRLVRQALAAGAGWVWFIDDDHTFGADILGRLLRHDRDIVVPHVLTRVPPHAWVAWELFPIPPDISDRELAALAQQHGHHPPLAPRQGGLVEIGYGGTGGMLISAEVLRAMADPWFEFGRFTPDSPGEDGWFCLKARRLGYQMFCDVDTPMGHLNTAAIWPQRDPVSGLFKPHIQLEALLRAGKLSSRFDDTRCGACGTELFD